MQIWRKLQSSLSLEPKEDWPSIGERRQQLAQEGRLCYHIGHRIVVEGRQSHRQKHNGCPMTPFHVRTMAPLVFPYPIVIDQNGISARTAKRTPVYGEGQARSMGTGLPCPGIHLARCINGERDHSRAFPTAYITHHAGHIAMR